MRTNLKAILSAVSVAALLASPAMANSHARHHAAPSIVPYGAHASVGLMRPSLRMERMERMDPSRRTDRPRP
jgi:hypothetical protein